MSLTLRTVVSIRAKLRASRANLNIRISGSNAHFSDGATRSPRRTWEPRKTTDRIKSSNQLKFEMEMLFFKALVKQGDVDSFIAENIKSFDYQNLSELMRLSVKPSRVARVQLLGKHLPSIAVELQLSNLRKWTFKEISFIIYGLQGMDQNDPGALEVIEIMTKIATKSIQKISPNEQEISMLLLGLQHMSHDKEEVRKLLLLIASMVNRCSDKFIAQTIGNIFYSLQRMESDCAEVRSVLTALYPKVLESKSELSSQHVGNALYGLRGMHSDILEVRIILTALVRKIETCQQIFTAQEVSNSIYGMQCMNSDYSEVRAVIAALTSKIWSCKETFSAQHISNVLYGLQGMSSNCPEVRGVLSAIAPKFRDSKDLFDDQTVGNALYGLQGMRSGCKEVSLILSTLVPKVYGCTYPLGVRDIANGLYGLQGLGHELESLLLFDFLFKQIDLLATKSSDFQGLSTGELFYLCQILILSLVEVKVALKDRYPQWEKVNELANKELIVRRDANDPFFIHGKIRSTNEVRVRNIATTLFQNSRILMSFNGFLFGLFETDLVLKIPSTGSSIDDSFYINIEMEGLYHKQQRRERFRILRDRYLKSQGVVIERIDLLTLRQMDDAELMKWLLSRVTAATSAIRQPKVLSRR